jgi:hypothetical protein
MFRVLAAGFWWSLRWCLITGHDQRTAAPRWGGCADWLRLGEPLDVQRSHDCRGEN